MWGVGTFTSKCSCDLVCVFSHLSAWDSERVSPGVANPTAQGEATGLGGGCLIRFPLGENGAVVSCSHLLKASLGVGGSGNQRKS